MEAGIKGRGMGCGVAGEVGIAGSWDGVRVICVSNGQYSRRRG